MKQNKKLIRKEKQRISRLLGKDLSYKSNQEILRLVEEHESEQLESFKKTFNMKGSKIV